MRLAPAEQLLYHGHPSWRSMVGYHLRALLAAILTGVLVGLATAAASGHVAAWGVTIAVLMVVVLAAAVGLVRRRATTYTITTRRLVIETGLIRRDVREARLEQIQNVNLTQSLPERLLDVGTVAVDTAGIGPFGLSFAGIEEPRRLLASIEHALSARYELV